MSTINNLFQKYLLEIRKVFFFDIDLSQALVRLVRIKILNSNFIFNLNKHNHSVIFNKLILDFLRALFKKKFFYDFTFFSKSFYFFLKILRVSYYLIKYKKSLKKSSVDILYYCTTKHHDNYIKKLLEKSSFSYSKLDISKFRSLISLKEINFFFDSYDYFQIKYDILSIDKAIDFYRPKILICIEGDKYQDYLLTSLAKKKNITSICLQWGVFIDHKPNIALQNLNFEYYFAWGEYFIEEFKKYNSTTKFINIGNFNNLHSRKKGKKIVFFLQPVNNYYISKVTLNRFYSVIIWCLKNLDEKIIIRTHPALENQKSLNFIKRSDNVIIHRATNVSIEKTLDEARVCIALYSSAILESAASGIFSIFYFEKNHYTKINKKLQINNNIIIAENISRLKKIISNRKQFKDFKDTKYKKKNSNYFISKCGINSIQYTNKILNKILEKV